MQLFATLLMWIISFVFDLFLGFVGDFGDFFVEVLGDVPLSL